MDAELRKIDRSVREYDRDLYAIRNGDGVVYVFRQGKSIHDSMLPDGLNISQLPRPNPQFVLALTDTLTIYGKPVTWGIEPLIAHLKMMDIWRSNKSDREFYNDLIDRRNTAKREQERQNQNSFRANALDMRRNVSKAVDEVTFRR